MLQDASVIPEKLPQLLKMLEKSLLPESWPLDSDERKRCERTACLYFNGWLFEGYDDAKSAMDHMEMLES